MPTAPRPLLLYYVKGLHCVVCEKNGPELHKWLEKRQSAKYDASVPMITLIETFATDAGGKPGPVGRTGWSPRATPGWALSSLDGELIAHNEGYMSAVEIERWVRRAGGER